MRYNNNRPFGPVVMVTEISKKIQRAMMVKENLRQRNIPVGTSSFREVRTEGAYYIDKTGLIEELLSSCPKATLITRPRRFGKTMAMSMMAEFFDIRKDNAGLFEDLRIARNEKLCAEWMNQYPVIALSLRKVDGPDYDTAAARLSGVIADLYKEHLYLLKSDRVNVYDRERMDQICAQRASMTEVGSSLELLTRMLRDHYGRPVILLMDEYDVPLSKASEHGYYAQMLDVVRALMQALKDNEALKFAVVTGCLRVAKESIFTGLNNLVVRSICDNGFDRYFGFTDAEVRRMLEDYGLTDSYETIRSWYDGYQFGSTRVYCPWDVLNYCDALRMNPEAFPENYWSNTSGNDAVRRFICNGDNQATKREIEALVAGETIEKEIHQELTYEDMYASVDNIWSVLFTTGYLTQRERISGTRFRLAIPNYEIRSIYTTQIMDLFRESVRKDGESVENFCSALYEGNPQEAQRILGRYLRTTISVRDEAVQEPYKENFYHGILLGILAAKDSWAVFSNRESGDGYSDILIEPESPEIGIVIELKYPKTGNLEEACKSALKQIEDKHYAEKLEGEGYEHILRYGIACYKKRCRIMLDDKPGASGR